MKKINGILGFFKLLLKFGTIIMIGIDIVNYAIERIEKEYLPKSEKIPLDENISQ